MFKKVGIVSIVVMSLMLMAFTLDFKKEKKKFTLKPTYEPIVVLELFTSQGCSSCPAADILLEKSKKAYQKEVFALSYHVDYWNYIGWKDPFSKSSYAQKQRKYNVKFKNRSNYTPQLVINGMEHIVGSDQAKLTEIIGKYKTKKTENHLIINSVNTSENSIALKYIVEGSLENKNVRALLVLDERTTSVKRGENRNRTLKNNNIVVAEKIVDLKQGEVILAIPDLVKPKEKISVIVLVEDSDFNIVAASKQLVTRK